MSTKKQKKLIFISLIINYLCKIYQNMSKFNKIMEEHDPGGKRAHELAKKYR